MLYSGKNFTIRHWQKGDETHVALHANNFNIWKNVRDLFPHPYTYDDAVVWIDMNLKQDEKTSFAITVDNEPIGSIGFILGSDVHKMNIEIGYWLGEEYWGQGICSEAVAWLISYCFEQFNIKRIFASVFSNNQASARVLIKNGFFHEATLKSTIFKNNEFLDEYIFSLVR